MKILVPISCANDEPETSEYPTPIIAGQRHLTCPLSVVARTFRCFFDSLDYYDLFAGLIFDEGNKNSVSDFLSTKTKECRIMQIRGYGLNIVWETVIKILVIRYWETWPYVFCLLLLFSYGEIINRLWSFLIIYMWWRYLKNMKVSRIF